MNTNGRESGLCFFCSSYLCGALSIAYGAWAIRSVLEADPGNARMQEIAAAIQEGAGAYLRRQYTTIAIAGAIIFLIVAFLLGLPSPSAS